MIMSNVDGDRFHKYRATIFISEQVWTERDLKGGEEVS